ncbi:MAG: lysophospholipid acyltransferase family protein [Clostridia bacterium]
MSKKIDDLIALQEKLEHEGAFDTPTEPINMTNVAPVDKDYVYLRTSLRERFLSGFARGILYIFSPIVDFFAYKFRIKGKENLRALKGTSFFSISNHVSYLDSLMLRDCLRGRRVYFTVAPFNNKRGYKGAFLRAGGAIPLSDSLSGMKNFNSAIHTLAEGENNVIQFYAEQTMWIYFEKPRPFKKGAFRFAAKEMKPILPMFITFSPAKGWRKLLGAKRFATMHILPAIFPRQELSVKENCDFLQEETQRAFIAEYRQVYGDNKPIIYDIDENAMSNLNQETELAIKLSQETCDQKAE